METVCQLNFNMMSEKEARRAEAILREYLLRVSDQVSMSRIGSSPLSLFQFFPHRIKARRFMRMLKPGDIASRSSQDWTFNLTDNVKNLLNQASLLFSGSGRFFTGFSDPVFIRKGNDIAHLRSNRRLVNLYIQDKEKAELSSKGISLDNPEI